MQIEGNLVAESVAETQSTDPLSKIETVASFESLVLETGNYLKKTWRLPPNKISVLSHQDIQALIYSSESEVSFVLTDPGFHHREVDRSFCLDLPIASLRLSNVMKRIKEGATDILSGAFIESSKPEAPVLKIPLLILNLSITSKGAFFDSPFDKQKHPILLSEAKQLVRQLLQIPLEIQTDQGPVQKKEAKEELILAPDRDL